MIDIEFFDEAAAEQGGLSVVVLDEQPELTEVEVEELLDRLSACQALIDTKRKSCDAMKAHYQAKIAKAEDIYEAETRYARAEIDSLTAELRRYAELNITGKKRSMKFPSGTLSFSKSQPQFFIDGQAVTNDNPKLIEIARKIDAELVKTKEVVAWGELRHRLVVDGTAVYVKDTGEVITDLRARTEPDKFSVKPA